MNNVRTLFLIFVSVIQIPGMLTNINWKSLQLTELAGKVCTGVKHDTSISNKCDNYTDIKDAKNNQPPIKSFSETRQIIFNGTMSAELF